MLSPNGLAAVEVIKDFVPEFSVKRKTDSWHQRLIGRLMSFNKAFMTHFVTTMGYTAYLPSAYEEEPRDWQVIFHEGRHALDAKILTIPVFFFQYLVPASLSALFIALAVIASPLWLIPAVVSLLPLPAPGRYWSELRGYKVSMAISYWLEEECYTDPDWYIENVIMPNFTGWAYYKMFPFKGILREELRSWVEKLQIDEATKNDEYLSRVKEFTLQVKDY